MNSALLIKNTETITELWKEIFYKRKKAWLRVSSGSMAPLINEDARILVSPLEDKKIKFGDVVLFTDGDKLIAHRVLSILSDKNKFLQCGDYACSPSFISVDNIIGVVQKVKIDNSAREINFNSAAGRLFNILMGTGNYSIMYLKKICPKAGNMLNNLRFRIVDRIINERRGKR